MKTGTVVDRQRPLTERVERVEELNDSQRRYVDVLSVIFLFIVGVDLYGGDERQAGCRDVIPGSEKPIMKTEEGEHRRGRCRSRP